VRNVFTLSLDMNFIPRFAFLPLLPVISLVSPLYAAAGEQVADSLPDRNKTFISTTFGSVVPAESAGSVTMISQEDFNKGFIQDPAGLVTGRIPGLLITTADGSPFTQYDIRSLRSSALQFPIAPLIVVDDVPLMGTTPDIDPYNIESISYLNSGPADIYGGQAANGVILIQTKKGSDKLRLNYTGRVAVSALQNRCDVFSADEFRNLVTTHFDGQPEVTALLGDADTDWQDEIYRTAVSHDHHLSVSGPLLTVPSRLSLGKSFTHGTIETSDYDRSTVSASLTPSFFNDYLRLQLNVNGTVDNNSIPDNQVSYFATAFDPTQPVYSEDGEYTSAYFTVNPVALLDLTDNRLKRNHWITDFAADYRFHFLPQMRIALNIAADDVDSKLHSVTDTAASLGWNSYGRVADHNYSVTNRMANLYLNYSGTIKAVEGKIDLTAGYFSHQASYNDLYKVTALYNPDYFLSLNEYSYESNQISFYGKINFSMMQKYFLTFTLRNDAYSGFSADNSSGLSPSVNIAWNLKNESFLADNRTIADLSIYFGYGNIAAYRPEYLDPEHPVYDVSRIISPDLKPETKNYLNSGIRCSLFDDRLRGTLSAFSNLTSDLITEVRVPSGGNFSRTVLFNVGEISDKGLELTLETELKSGSDLVWNLGFFGSLHKNRIISLAPGIEFIETGTVPSGIGTHIQRNETGYPVNSFYAMQQVYNDEGRPVEGLFVDITGEGTVNYADRRHYKTSDPSAVIGISSSAAWKQWKLAFSGRANLGNYLYNSESLSGNYLNILSNQSLENIPALIENSEFNTSHPLSDYYIENASFFRMDYISLSYDLKKLFGSKIDCSLSAAVQNAFTLTGYSGSDPENVSGISGFTWPRARTASLEVSLSF
jgi:TonB-dependent starch-binding outer membrane protein SusC